MQTIFLICLLIGVAFSHNNKDHDKRAKDEYCYGIALSDSLDMGPY